MIDRAGLESFLWIWIGVAVATFVVLFFVTAPYGRHARRGWGPTVSNRVGWILMEAPSPIGFAAVFLASGGEPGVGGWVLFAMWEAHYLHRAFLYPMTLRTDGKRMPLAVASMAVLFNLVNAGTNAAWIASLSGGYGAGWLLDPRFLVGAALFVGGAVVNKRSDAILRALRAPGTTGYAIPRGGGFEWVSSPNYLGEIVQWIGWAVATWSLAGVGFAAWTIANLVPRARANHAWYRATFPDYPPERRALIPRIW